MGYLESDEFKNKIKVDKTIFNDTLVDILDMDRASVGFRQVFIGSDLNRINLNQRGISKKEVKLCFIVTISLKKNDYTSGNFRGKVLQLAEFIEENKKMQTDIGIITDSIETLIARVDSKGFELIQSSVNEINSNPGQIKFEIIFKQDVDMKEILDRVDEENLYGDYIEDILEKFYEELILLGIRGVQADMIIKDLRENIDILDDVVDDDYLHFGVTIDGEIYGVAWLERSTNEFRIFHLDIRDCLKELPQVLRIINQ